MPAYLPPGTPIRVLPPGLHHGAAGNVISIGADPDLAGMLMVRVRLQGPRPADYLYPLALVEPLTPIQRPPAAPKPPGEALNARDVERLRLLTTGCTLRAAAESWGLTHKSARQAALGIYARLGTHCRRDAIMAATQLGLI